MNLIFHCLHTSLLCTNVLWCKRELKLHTLKYKRGDFVRPLVICDQYWTRQWWWCTIYLHFLVEHWSSFNKCFYVLIVTCFYSLWIMQMHNVQWQLGYPCLYMMVSMWGHIGINAPHECGKTTIVDSLQYLFNFLGKLVQNHQPGNYSYHHQGSYSFKCTFLTMWKNCQ
jgi:hypothetical protein